MPEAGIWFLIVELDIASVLVTVSILMPAQMEKFARSRFMKPFVATNLFLQRGILQVTRLIEILGASIDRVMRW